MRILLVFCHPDRTSFLGSVLDALIERLEAGGHSLKLIDLYAEGFDPVLSAEAWRAHRQGLPISPDLAAHAEALRDCEAVALIYPTWWFGLPAVLKGWFERVWWPGVAFKVENGGFRTHYLSNVRRFAAVTTYGSPRWLIEGIVGDPARKQIMRGLALQLSSTLRTCWRPIYGADQRSNNQLARARDQAVDAVMRFFDRG